MYVLIIHFDPVSFSSFSHNKTREDK